jgi:2-polyprenyl-3-methyl-5-hydroxy-6-metoxy-1,4-benzoquinol methylase
MHSDQSNPFSDYARSHDARIRKGGRAILEANRIPMLDKCYGWLLRAHQPRRVLDYGCGSGDLLSWLSMRVKREVELHAYDISLSQIELAQKRLVDRAIFFHSASGSVEGKFDLVFCSHVIEHVPDLHLQSFVRDLCSKVDGTVGRLVISTPNGLNPFAYSFYMSGDVTHLRMHSPFTLADLLDREGFEIESVRRETPQVYDLMTLLKFVVWLVSVPFMKLALLSTAGGIRGLGQPLILAPTFYVVARAKRSNS